MLPKALRNLIESLGKLPGVGSRTAERYALALLKSDHKLTEDLSANIKNLHANIAYCEKTFALVDAGETISSLYSNPERNKKQVAVVAQPLDIISLENVGNYKGTYHVLGGLISPLDNISPEQLTIKQLVDRVNNDSVEEIILALNASVEGESTAIYIQRQLADKDVKITRLARGLPVGVDLEYADQSTLSRALEGRTTLS